jgi:hypothetical protein
VDTTFVAAVLIGAVLVYDRLGGNHELSRRLFQVGLALSLAFVVLSATAAFIRTGAVEGGVAFGSAANVASPTDQGNRAVSAATVHYALGVVFLIAGMAMLRRYHTLPLAFVLGGVFLLFMGGSVSGASTVATLARLGIQSSQKVDVASFATAVGGTIVLLGYGVQLEREFALDSASEENEADAESTGETAAGDHS